MPARRKGRARRPTVGLALGAGGARGIAHVGVLRALAHASIPVDAIVGTSIGALVAAVHATGCLDDFERWLRRMDWADALRFFDPVWPRSGLLSGTRALARLGELLGDRRIEDLPIRFAAVAVDLVTGDEILIREGRVIDAVRASASIPGVFVPYRQGRRLFVDGALRNPVPVSALGEMGADVRIAVNLHGRPVREIVGRPRSRGRKGRRTVTGRVVEAIDQGLARFRRRGRARSGQREEEAGPNLFEILTASMTVLEQELALHRLARDTVDVVLEPEVHGIRSFEFHKSRQAIHSGRRETELRLPEIRAALKRRRTRRRG